MDHEYDVLGGYVPSFVQHLKDTGARLGTRLGSEANEGRISTEDAAEPYASSSWTPSEQDAFFRAVSVHSRWRPDLIAACVPTKTEWEVWMYLEALEEGVAALAMHQVDGDDALEMEMHVDGSGSDSRSRSGSDMDENEDANEDGGGDVDVDVCEPALEVSQAWVDAEEYMAAWIVDREYLASVEGDAAAHIAQTDKKPAKLKRGRPRKAPGETASNKSSPPPVRRSATSEAPSAPERSQDPSILPEREREALMGRLEVPHLLVLDSILREGEEAIKGRSKSREGSVIVATLTEQGDDGAPRAGDADMSSLSDRITGSPETTNVPEFSSSMVIDPALLALSGGVDPTHTGRQSGVVPSQHTVTGHVPALDSSSLPSASSRESPQAGTSNMFMSPPSKAAPMDPDQNANAEPELSLFSPRLRRRIQKRLYMRRKRALLRGESIGTEGSLDAGIERLRPGKKAKLERSEASVTSTSAVPCSEAPSNAEAELSENVPKKNKAGLTLPYKLKTKFAEFGVDAAYLCGQGLGLLNLGAMGRLMGLYASLERGEEEADGSTVAESIDAELIRYLQAAMVSFVTDVMHRAIVWREREIRLKQRSRAWRHGDQLTIGAVEHAVAAIGIRYHSHKAYFKSLEAFHGLSTEASSAPENATVEPNNRDASVDPDVGAGEPPELSPHRDVYTPLVCPPPGWRTSALACLTRTYEREATRTRRGTSADTEDDLMGDETDEEGLEAELAGEEERDGRDTAASATLERDLWGGVGVNK